MADLSVVAAEVACIQWLQEVRTWADPPAVEYVWGAGAPRRVERMGRLSRGGYRPDGLDCGGLVGEAYAVGDGWALRLDDKRDRGAVHAPDPETRTGGGWLWEAAKLAWLPQGTVTLPRPGDLVGWPGRRHVGLLLALEWPRATIIEASGTKAHGGQVRIRVAAIEHEGLYAARPFAHIVSRWADGRAVPARTEEGTVWRSG